MNIPRPFNSSFSTVVPGLQLAWDSTSMGTLKRCPREYYYTIICGLTPRLRSVDLDFGIYIHNARERFYHARAAGKPHDEALDIALDYVMNVTWDKELNRPWASGDANKNRATLVRTLIWYVDKWQNDPLETIIRADGKPAVELSFRFPLEIKNSVGETFTLCGHIDRLVTFQKQVWISDLKSTRHTISPEYFGQFTPDNQMSTYYFAGKIIYAVPAVGIIIDAAQVAVTFSRFERGMVHRTDAQLDEWYKDFQIYVQHAEAYARADYWPMNDKACFRCSFRGLCDKPPSARESWIGPNMKQRTWDPLIARGDI